MEIYTWFIYISHFTILLIFPTINVSHNQTHECELTNLSRTAVDAAAWSSSVAERRRPAIVAVAVSFVVTNLQRITNPGQILSSSSSSLSSSSGDVSSLNKTLPTPWLLQVFWASQSKPGSRAEALTHWKSMQVWKQTDKPTNKQVGGGRWGGERWWGCEYISSSFLVLCVHHFESTFPSAQGLPGLT